MKHDNQSLLIRCSALKYDYHCQRLTKSVNLCDNKYCINIHLFPIANSAFLPHKEVVESQAMTTQPADRGPHYGVGTRPHLELWLVQFERASTCYIKHKFYIRETSQEIETPHIWVHRLEVNLQNKVIATVTAERCKIFSQCTPIMQPSQVAMVD